MANTLKAKPAKRTRRVTTRPYIGTLTGNYVQASGAAGELLDPTSAADPNFLAEPIAGFLDLAALNASMYEIVVIRGPAGYAAKILLSTAATGWNNALLLKIYSAPGVELAAAAYPAAILADTFEFEITGPNGTF
jgi:hypothetical protein